MCLQLVRVLCVLLANLPKLLSLDHQVTVQGTQGTAGSSHLP